MIKTQEKGEDRAEFGIFKKKRLEEDKCVSRGHVDGKREEGSVYLSVCWDIVRVGMLRRGEKDKKEKKLLVTPLFPHPSNAPFLLVVWKTLTPPPLLLHTSQSPPPLCYRSHTCQPRSASQSPAHGRGPNDPHLRGVRMIMKGITSSY